MRVLVYLLRRLSTDSVLCLALLALIFVGVELGDHGPRIGPRIGLARLLLGSLWGLPAIAVQLLPAALLLGGALGLSALHRRGELAAIALTGIGSGATLAAFSLFGVTFALAATGVGEHIVPHSEQRKAELWGSGSARLTGEAERPSWYRLPHGWLLEAKAGRPQTALLLDRFGLPQARLGFGTKGEWVLDGTADLARTQHPGRLRERFGAEARGAWEKLRGSAARSLLGSRAGLSRQVALTRGAGHQLTAELLILHSRQAFPWLCLVAALALWGQTLSHRERTALGPLVAALAWVGLLWLLVIGGWQAARAGALAAQTASWLPVAGGLAIAGSVGAVRLLRN